MARVHEASALAVATAVALWRWRRSAADDPWLARPTQWFWRVLRWTPLVAVAFVGALYALRHGVRSAVGLDYQHQPWAGVLVYESLKFSVFYRCSPALNSPCVRTRRWLPNACATLERLSAQARMVQLTQQMQPHFLFNALNTITSLVHDDPDAADGDRTAALARAATEAARRPLHPLADELALPAATPS
jgi:hypothetical protein